MLEHPGKVNSHPGKVKSHPGKVKLHPAKVKLRPAKVKLHPGKVKQRPGLRAGIPNSANSHAAKIKQRPGVSLSRLQRDVGIPNSALIPKALGEHDRIDKIKEFEWFSLFAITNFYRGGTIAPLMGIISDWANAPSMEYLFLLDYYLSNNFFVEAQGRIFTNFGRNVDEPFGIGRYSQNDEMGVKLTYQF